MDGLSLPAATLLMALGILGRLLQQEQPVPDLRRALRVHGLTDNEITLVFTVLREGRISGPRPKSRTEGKVHYWSLEGVTFKP